MQQQLRIDLHDLGYRPSAASSAPEASEIARARARGRRAARPGARRGRGLRVRPAAVDPAAPPRAARDRALGGPGQLGGHPQGVRAGRELAISSRATCPMAHIYSDLAARLIERGTGRPGNYRFGRLEFDPDHAHGASSASEQIRLTQQQTALVLFLAQGSKPATARDLIEAGLFRTNAAHSTVHSALLTLRRRLDELEPELGPAASFEPRRAATAWCRSREDTREGPRRSRRCRAGSVLDEVVELRRHFHRHPEVQLRRTRHQPQLIADRLQAARARASSLCPTDDRRRGDARHRAAGEDGDAPRRHRRAADPRRVRRRFRVAHARDACTPAGTTRTWRSWSASLARWSTGSRT